MALIDWIVLLVTLAGMVAYGVYKSRHVNSLEGYFLGDRNMPWGVILLSIMSTQASAITFLGAPGQAYTDGLRFVQNYFGLPLAMVVISAVFVPIYHKLKLYTAYEFLEQRFDAKTRTLTAFLFLLSRGVSTGISIYAPAIILSSLLGWNIYLTNVVMGGLLIIYTVSGGAKAVAHTQQLQFIIILCGMAVAGVMVVRLLPQGVGFADALNTGKSFGRLSAITNGQSAQGFDWKDKYNIWSGLLGGFFLSLSYFGTDQSQVGRYLAAKNISQSRMGLLMNGLVKIPMQFLILLVGVLVFAFYQYKTPPVFFNETLVAEAKTTRFKPALDSLQQQYNLLAQQQNQWALAAPQNEAVSPQMQANFAAMQQVRTQFKAKLKEAVPAGESSDTNYIFLYFVLHHLPKGLVGLLIAAIILASWGSIAAALNSLASCTVIDLHQKASKKPVSSQASYRLSWQYTLGWGLFSIAVAMFATNMGSLIEAVNVLGSLFYGVILGVFLVAFFLKCVQGSAVFWSAVLVEVAVVTIYKMDVVSFLWLNVIGAVLVLAMALVLQPIFTAIARKA
ncbi:MAG: sodium:solute symporter [Bacteroidetes bacterium]|nr:MAG: sodium:solute symporter [Bacteroidota bacterium]